MADILALKPSAQHRGRREVSISPLSAPPTLRPQKIKNKKGLSLGSDEKDAANNSPSSPESVAQSDTVEGRQNTARFSGNDDDGDDNDQHTPSSPSSCGRGTKRAASTSTQSIGNTKLENHGLATPGARAVDRSKDYICLCTPAPKVPRPRNAFILYRQHHQAQVASHNPGLANPDISKIIGEQWREEAEEVKNSWKGLAEEEKQRHQRQYPNYRYQPRRGTRGPPGGIQPSGVDESGRCPKCGGRYIATPRTPTAGCMAPTAAKPQMPPFYGPNMGFPRDDHGYDRRLGQVSHAIKLQPCQARRDAAGGELEPLSPSSDVKRRRVNPPASYQAMVDQYGNPMGSSHGAYARARQPSANMPLFSPNQPYRGPGTLPSPAMLSKANAHMAPQLPLRSPYPPFAASGYPAATGHSNRSSPFDESLRLPPLQVPQSPQPKVVAGAQANFAVVANAVPPDSLDATSESVETLVMKIPFLNKLNVLRKISAPLTPPSRSRGTEAEVRGAVIAVEGPNAHLLKHVGYVISKTLGDSDEVAVKTWSSGLENFPGVTGNACDDGVEGHVLQTSDMFASYLQTITSWHDKAREMVQYITTLPRASIDSRMSSDTAETMSSDNSHLLGKLPVALLPEGFSVTISDKFACATPIGDSYSPVDHWQWMATLWRGVIGPDLVIYVRVCSEDEVARMGSVDVKLQSGIIIVRVTHEGKNKSVKMDERTERRLAFEVMEWVRGRNFRDELRSG